MGQRRNCSAGGFAEQGLALVGAEALQPAALGDPDGLHHATGLDLAQTRQRLEHGEDLHLADGLVPLSHDEELRKVDRADLQLLFDLGPLTADAGGLGQSGLALFGCECRRLWHGRNDSASAASGHAGLRRTLQTSRYRHPRRPPTMTDTGAVPAIDLNADLAEGDELATSDLALLGLVTSASVACGFHAGSRASMRRAAAECVARGVSIGAHISYRDREGFGRRTQDPAHDRLADDVIEQWETLVEEAAAVGAFVSYVKPHGALYPRMAADPEVAAVVVEALTTRCAVLVAPPGSAVAAPARAASMRLVIEGFCDRGYGPDGALVARGDAGAMIEEPEAVAERARSLAIDRGVPAVDGSWVALDVETLCMHGDGPGADRTGRAVRAALESAGVAVRPFTGTPSTGPSMAIGQP